MLEETLRLSYYESSLPQKYALIRKYNEGHGEAKRCTSD